MLPLRKIVVSSVIIIVAILGVACSFTAGFGCQLPTLPANDATQASVLLLTNTLHDMVANEIQVPQQASTQFVASQRAQTETPLEGIHMASALPSASPLSGSMPAAPSKWIKTTLSYSVVGGGTGYATPTLTYILGGIPHSATLSTSPIAYRMDSGSEWSVNNPLSGSTGIETWITNQQTSGTASSSQTISLSYYHQYSISLGYSVSGTGTGYSPPNATVVQFGALSTVTVPAQLFVDAGSQYSLQNPLPGSSSSERWFAASSQGTGSVSGPGTISPTYYHQYSVVFSFSVEGGGNPPPPVLNGTSLASPTSQVFGTTPSVAWLDPGSSYTYNFLLNSSATERWITNLSSVSGTVSAPVTLSPVYTHQVYVTIESDSAAGGSISPASNWFDAGQMIQISAVANAGWQFEGWNGSGASSYSGLLNTTTAVLNSPIVEYATFYPGLTINTSNYGGVTYMDYTMFYYGAVPYSYSLGSGSVPSSTSVVLYFPLNDSILLTPNSLYIFQLKSWSGDAVSNAQQIQIVASAPMAVQANFDFNWLNIGITIVMIAGGLAVLITLFRFWILKNNP